MVVSPWYDPIGWGTYTEGEAQPTQTWHQPLRL